MKVCCIDTTANSTIYSKRSSSSKCNGVSMTLSYLLLFTRHVYFLKILSTKWLVHFLLFLHQTQYAEPKLPVYLYHSLNTTVPGTFIFALHTQFCCVFPTSPQLSFHFFFTSGPPTSSHTAVSSNQPCFHRNHCHGNADSGSLQCRKNLKLTTQGLNVQPAKDRATTKTL